MRVVSKATSSYVLYTFMRAGDRTPVVVGLGAVQVRVTPRSRRCTQHKVERLPIVATRTLLTNDQSIVAWDPGSSPA